MFIDTTGFYNSSVMEFTGRQPPNVTSPDQVIRIRLDIYILNDQIEWQITRKEWISFVEWEWDTLLKSEIYEVI